MTAWVWYKVADSGDQVIQNGSQSRFFISHSEAQSELHIKDLT